jgi:hypothetical protein
LRCALIIAAAGLVPMALPVSAQENTNTANAAAASQTSEISQEALDSLLAPIALYPDALLAQVLMAATYPMDVIEAARWQQAHPDLSGQALQNELASFDWDPSVKSLVTVPQVLHYMSDSPRWMQDLGYAVLDDQPWVMESVQVLRQKAHATGTLVSNDKQTVSVGTDTTTRVEYITIAPVSTQVVYVPVYDPHVVYGAWWWPSRPVYWRPPPGVVFSAGYFWGPRYYPSVALWGNFNWGIGMITINAPVYSYYYRAPPPMGPHNVWRRPPPVYAPPVGGYHRPPYAGRPPVAYPPGRDPRPPSSRPPGANRPSGNAPNGGYQAPGRQPRPEAPSGANRPSGNAPSGGYQAPGRQPRPEAPSGANRPSGNAPGGGYQAPGRQPPPSGANRPSGTAPTPSNTRQTGGQWGEPDSRQGASSGGPQSGNAIQRGPAQGSSPPDRGGQSGGRLTGR